MNIDQIIDNYQLFAEKHIANRFLKYAQLQEILDNFSHVYSILPVGTSVEARKIKLVQIGTGPSKILLWSQMHGNEPTGTMALIDLLHYFEKYAQSALVEKILRNCTLYLIPMVNPDGAERFIRRNAQQIDINRDFLASASPEAKVLKKIQAEIQPHFGFNLHDQSTLWSVEGSMAPATLSYLAPAVDVTFNVPEGRAKAMKVIADIYEEVQKYIPNNIGLFDDTFEPRAFGDNFQKLGTATILIEAGGLAGDLEKQEIRKYYFLSLLKGLTSIATESYLKKSTDAYFAIPKNGKQLYHLILKNVQVNGLNTNICLNYEEIGAQAICQWRVHDVGDFTGFASYKIVEGNHLTISEYVEVDALANFTLMQNDKIKLVFKNGKLVD